MSRTPPRSCSCASRRWCRTARDRRPKAFRKLGISAQDLIDKSPEDMLLTVVAALQNVTNEADRKFLADELLGGSSEKLAGLLNLTNEELADQLQHLADTGDFMSRDALDAAKGLFRRNGSAEKFPI